jgi:uncharacterized membrane protein YhaH (DUF805 family)
MDYMFLPLRRYADFSGRSRRMEYWMFVLFVTLVFIGGVAVLIALVGSVESLSSGGGDPPPGIIAGAALLGVFYLAILIPMLAVQVRRFHDQGKSGWMVLLNFIPYVGGLVVLVFMCMEGTRGPNQYGPDPKGDQSNVFV